MEFAGMLWWLRAIQQSEAVSQNGSETFNFMSGGNEEIDLDHRAVVCSDFGFPVLRITVCASNYTGTYASHNILVDTRVPGSAPEGFDGSEGSLASDVDNTGSKESSPGNLENQNKIVKNVDNGLPQEEGRQPEQSFNLKINGTHDNSSTGRVGNETTITTSDQVETSVAGFPSPSPVTPSTNSSPSMTASVLDRNISTPAVSGKSNATSVELSRTITSENNENSEPVHTDLRPKDNSSSVTTVTKINDRPEMPVLDVYSLSDMNNLLLQSRASYYSVIPQWSSAVDHELQDVASQIENAPAVQNDPNLYAPLYRNVSTFKRSYELMEQTLKVYIYKEGERPILHTPVLKGLYASEGWFMRQLEANKRFVTKNPKKAHLFYLPFSSRMLEETLYVPNSHSHKNLIEYLKNYLDMIASKYPFWNRTGGADHFLVACHDWAPTETKEYMAKCVRALCNADVKEGFVFGKDVSLPETYIQLPKDPLRNLGGKPLSKRSILAFFAGSMHGYLRPILLQHWENKDPDMKIFGKLPKKKRKNEYANYMKTSKYCICAKGYEVNSPRVVEAIFYECVPVIISDNFVPPFFQVLNWESFAVFVLEKDIPNLKNILLSIPEKRYKQMQMMVKRVQKHFLWHARPEKYDIFHIILHSIWYNRLHQISPI
ncbi:Exostosin-like [Parasponia andersonii]|uniref:Exostosin-like n=1 Tax=Parasponia andersonii TaxID=3476 RepID=A0A2P5D3C8_PARAD|nr:Exostosin-like [Parasponia andersonii]